MPHLSPLLFSALLLLLAALLTACSTAQNDSTKIRNSKNSSPRPTSEDGTGPQLRLASVTIDGRSYPYALFLPAGYDSARRWPLVLFLHGRGESGTNGTRQLTVGLPKHVLWDSGQWPCVILMPQKPDADAPWEAFAPALVAMLDRVEREQSIDPARVVLTGLSQGGHGCWSLNEAAPGRFAALAPVCGFAAPPRSWEAPDRAAWRFDANNVETARLIEAARAVPSWIFHGEADSVVPIEHSLGMAGALRAAGADVRVTSYPGVDHNSWDQAYSDPALRAWLLNARRP